MKNAACARLDAQAHAKQDRRPAPKRCVCFCMHRLDRNGKLIIFRPSEKVPLPNMHRKHVHVRQRHCFARTHDDLLSIATVVLVFSTIFEFLICTSAMGPRTCAYLRHGSATYLIETVVVMCCSIVGFPHSVIIIIFACRSKLRQHSIIRHARNTDQSCVSVSGMLCQTVLPWNTGTYKRQQKIWRPKETSVFICTGCSKTGLGAVWCVFVFKDCWHKNMTLVKNRCT